IKSLREYQKKLKSSISQAENLALAVDAWSNIRNEYILNYTILTPKPYFINSITSETNRHTAEYLCDLMIHALEKYDPHKFLVIITDNAANEKKAALLLKQTFTHLIPLELVRPIVKWIHLLESDEPFIHKVVHAFKQIKQSLTDSVSLGPITPDVEKMIFEKFPRRHECAVQPIHLAAVILDPKDLGVNLDPEELLNGIEFIDTLSKTMTNIDPVVVLTSLTKYRNKESMWDKEMIWKTVESFESLTWWKGVGSINCRQLARVAIRILSMPTSSASTERTNSTMGRVHCAKRNRLTTKRAIKLTFISHNYKLRVRSKKTSESQTAFSKEAGIVQESYQNQKRLKSSDNRTTKRRKGDSEL
ncbi:hypothetical protein ILUMI_18350, partial [Ignelater luminosus]